MPSSLMNVTREDSRALPSMLVQAIAIAAILCVAEILCSPIFIQLTHQSVALVPWIFVACLCAVVFSYTVGFALLWCAESLARHIRESLVPIAYGCIGLIGFGIWGSAVVGSLLNSILVPLGFAVLTSSQTVTIAVNSAVLGFASFFLAFLAPRVMGKCKGMVIVAGICTLLCAVAGVFFLSRMMSVLY